MSRAVLSIGSNVGDRLAHLQSVCDGLAPAVQSVSAVFATAPWGGVAQEDFFNAVLVVDDPDVDADGWLRRGHELEAAADRTREVRWGPRTLDVDVVAVEDDDGRAVVSDDPVLTLPHPRAAERAFVLIPWLDAEPQATLWTAAGATSVIALVERLDRAEVDGVRPTDRTLALPTPDVSGTGT
ncbi:2-amino-4-hydroxy-6-hydroxymethyldihydropteridine diphosphokinase [Williamsia sterculiae]|uniref:2-amino-4-hydroxy-6-hydroxymethyldihydropteridine diphosphokinase n=1 Tax=Williamsia sterculiae TaxID=1344003 RepID=A0A1N7CRP8_9NOCA|nr:2-amino-4-hydroxy-6-hydroxymethyldihydropteridine diphosphokinase [Williamsia sterculiae]SIR66177.1 2-amino-4-hydroxy-6-hydroxymethyldihydropteridinediphosphokinase [Williamsia sterculiae]